MELQELEKIWNSSGNDFDNSYKINRDMLKEITSFKIRSKLSGIKWDCFIEIFINYLFIDSLIGFVAREIQDPKFSIPGIILLSAVVFGIALSIYKLSLYFRINADSSVIQAQELAAKLRYWELTEIKMLYVLIPVLSSAFSIVAAKGLINVDLYTRSDLLIYYTIGSFVVGLIITFLLKKFPDKNLQETITFLNELKESERVSDKAHL